MEALAYRIEARQVLPSAGPNELKRIDRLWVEDVRLEQEKHTVRTRYRVPYLKNLLAGAGCVEEEKTPFRRWIVENAFRMPHRLVEMVSRGQRVDGEQTR